jgi:hypothetical protein
MPRQLPDGVIRPESETMPEFTSDEPEQATARLRRRLSRLQRFEREAPKLAEGVMLRRGKGGQRAQTKTYCLRNGICVVANSLISGLVDQGRRTLARDCTVGLPEANERPSPVRLCAYRHHSLPGARFVY